MAEIQEYDNEVSEIEAVEQQQEAKQDPQVDDDETDIPEEFRGKSRKEIAKMAHDRMVMIGKQAQEVGEVRRLADELIKSQLEKKPKEVEREIDFFENPQEAVRQAVANSPDVVQAKQMAIRMQQEQAKQELMRKHPDFGQVVQDSEFVDWVNSSKKRTQMYNEAQNYDVDSADELFSTFKQIRGIKQQQMTKVISEDEKKLRNKALSAASVDTSGSGESSQKVWRRADLIRMQIREPSRYEAMGDEILKAYSEGRVK